MSCANGVCAPTTASAVLNVGDLETLLASGNVTVTTTGSGVQAANIVVAASLTWSTASTLGLDAYQSITVKKPVSVAGTGGLSVTTNDGGSNGYLTFGPKGHVTFANLASALTIDGAAYALESNIKSLASAIAANPSGDYALASDFDAKKDGTYAAPPIPTTLTGTVEGLGNVISNFSMTVPKGRYPVIEFGLFAEVGKGGAIESLDLSAVNVDVLATPKKFAVSGSLVGGNEGYLFDDHVSGNLSTKQIGGGLVGASSGTIMLSSSDIAVSGSTGAGGLTGSVGTDGGIVSESYATGSVSGGNDSFVGGLAGGNVSEVINSYATGTVSGGKNAKVGGLVGENTFGANSYSTGQVSGRRQSYVGGFTGYEEGLGNQNCYWDVTTSGTSEGTGNEGNIADITGLTTAQFQVGLPKGFHKKFWAENPKINGGFPYLINNQPR
jgi:hypothetical protein